MIVIHRSSRKRAKVEQDSAYGALRHFSASSSQLAAFSFMPFDLQPVLHGTLLHLRPLRPDDRDALYGVASDPLIWEQHPCSDRYKEDVFRTFFAEALESRGAFVVLDAADGRIIGSSRFHGYDESKGEIEIGWTFLARKYWGGLYNAELKQLMLRHAFQFVERVIFLVGPTNLRSQRALEKIGAVRAGSTIKNGAESLVYELRASSTS
jgi:RimJ/RimL family protein N-acetyltransferase